MDLFIKFLVAAVGAGTPLLFGTVGEILNEKVGHLNLGVEGMMAIGACAGFMAGYLTDNFALALLAAFAAGVLAALIYAVLTVTFLANQNVAGLTMTIFGVGLSNFIGVYMLDKSGASTLKLPENVTAQMRSVTIPALSDLPVVGELQFDVLLYRLSNEYNVEVKLEKLPYEHIRWIENKEIDVNKIQGTSDMKRIKDLKDNALLLFVNSWSVGMVLDRNPALKLSEFGRA